MSNFRNHFTHLVAVYLQWIHAGFFLQSRVFMIRERLSITSNLEDSKFPSNFASNFRQNFISFWNILALSKHLELYKINDNFTERRRYYFCTKRYLGIKLTSLHWLKSFSCPEIEAYFYLNILHKHLFSSLGRPRPTWVFMNGFKANKWPFFWHNKT